MQYRIIMYQLEYGMSTKLTYVKISVRLRYTNAQSRICESNLKGINED